MKVSLGNKLNSKCSPRQSPGCANVCLSVLEPYQVSASRRSDVFKDIRLKLQLVLFRIRWVWEQKTSFERQIVASEMTPLKHFYRFYTAGHRLAGMANVGMSVEFIDIDCTQKMQLLPLGTVRVQSSTAALRQRDRAAAICRINTQGATASVQICMS